MDGVRRQLGAEPRALLLDERARVPGDSRREAPHGRPALEDIDGLAVAYGPRRARVAQEPGAQEPAHLAHEAGADHEVSPGGYPRREIGPRALEAREPHLPSGKGGPCAGEIRRKLRDRPARGKAAAERAGD